MSYHYRNGLYTAFMHLIGKKTMQDIIDSIGSPVEKKLRKIFRDAGVPYPPEKIIFMAYKNEKVLELWSAEGRRTRLVKSYPILGASGKSGPKLKEGDKQVPEGIYRVVDINPNSKFYLSLGLDYPNGFDREMAERDRRENIGFDIYIHGKTDSEGCLALGDPAIEELFILANKTGMENIEVIIAPHRIKKGSSFKKPDNMVPWIDTLYTGIILEMEKLKLL